MEKRETKSEIERESGNTLLYKKIIEIDRRSGVAYLSMYMLCKSVDNTFLICPAPGPVQKKTKENKKRISAKTQTEEREGKGRVGRWKRVRE